MELAGGHSEGMQMVRLESEGELAYYAGDIISVDAHRHLAVSSAYEICRRDTFAAKQKVLTELKQRKGILFLAHDINKQWIKVAD